MGAKKTGGLAGITAGTTHLCTVGKEGAGLTYCGYDIYDLADNASFEEVAYLLLRGNLPTQQELDDFIATVKSKRDARLAIAALTPAGRELLEDASSVVDDTMKTLLKRAPKTAADLDGLVEALDDIGH